MLSTYDRWILPKNPKEIPEIDGEDEERILLDILWKSFRQKIAVAYVPEHIWRDWMSREVIKDGPVFEALVEEHRKAIDERWSEEHEGR